MKKFWFEIILIIVGIIILSYSTDHSPNNSMMLKGIGISTFLLAFVWFIIHVTIINKKKEQTHSKDFPVKQGNIRHYDMIINDQHNLENDSFNHSTKNSDLKLDEKRIQFLREKITILNNFVQKQIISSEDIYSLSNSQLRSQDVDYIAEQLICPLFDLNTTVKRIENNIKTMNFSDDEFIRLMMYGSSSLQKHLFDTCEQTNWIMSSYVFYKISQFNPLLLFHFIYSEDTIHKAFNAMNAAELLGFRIKSKTKEQETPWSTIPTLDGTECPYYEDVDTDIIYVIEQNFPNNDTLRKQIFDKIFNSPYVLTASIERWDNVTEYEFTKILDRHNEEEIEALFDRDDISTIIDQFSEDIAIKVYLGLVYPNAVQTVKDSYTFKDVKTFKTIINELSAEELLGEDDYDIIKLIEDEMGDDEELRALAFAKLCQLPDMSSRISEWDNVTENETKLIMERNNDEEINALFGRDDSNDVICNLPDSLVIKFHLLDDEEVIHDEYFNRIDDDEFRGQVEKMTKGLLPKELTDSQKNSDVESLSDEIIIKARLGLFDLDECSFDSEEIADEFNDRINKDEFKKKIENLNFK